MASLTTASRQPQPLRIKMMHAGIGPFQHHITAGSQVSLTSSAHGQYFATDVAVQDQVGAEVFN
jgi:hypothetical protein